MQLFPNSTALQNVVLTPSFAEIVIPYPVLWGDFPPKIPEAEVKRLSIPSNQAVLPEPVIPSVIVVHDGRPEDKTVQNYTVGFTDYIKNVASSEIYATWPREALKANILAMLSFTLNRVYTEWYRGKGYDFTITNSTAFDQAFTFGRNIFQEVSNVVDEVFTTYISKPGIMQPLLTQYSDGKRVKREGWLSQWGSKELADQGFSALQILKNYYGYNIILKEAKKVEGIPLSFQGVLRVGATGEAVRTIQQQLNAISNNYPLIPKVIEDGAYCKPPFKDAACVVEYLGRYTHRVAISNNRILSMENGQVTFKWRDYRDGSRWKVMSLSAEEFIRRFLMHVLPARFMKIRHYGFLSSRGKQKKLHICKVQTSTSLVKGEKLSTEALIQKILGRKPSQCPSCGCCGLLRTGLAPPTAC